MEEDSNTIAVIGAGLAGSMTACMLARLGYSVRVFEKREDLRKVDTDAEVSGLGPGLHGTATSAVKRSINLALSCRGQKALHELGILEEVMKHAVPMPGRVIHDVNGHLQFQPYGKKGQAIYSISRSYLNTIMLDQAEDSDRVTLHFQHRLVSCSKEGDCELEGPKGRKTRRFRLVIGADGAYSSVRDHMLHMSRVSFSREYVPHGYKELSIPPTSNGEYALDLPNGLHIWPRAEFMLIALPNEDKSFTATLFAPFHGTDGFDSVDPKDPEKVLGYFKRHFPDVLEIMPDLVHDYRENPVGSLLSVRVNPWNLGRIAILGDAAHAVVPFYGQGMNAAFEDALQLYNRIKDFTATGRSLEEAVTDFAETRRPAADALTSLSYDNYTDMASHTTSGLFQFKRRVDALLHTLFPKSWIPLYTMVSFTDIPYHEARRRELRQQRILTSIVWANGIVAAAALVGGVYVWLKRVKA